MKNLIRLLLIVVTSLSLLLAISANAGDEQYRRWLDNGNTFTCTDTGSHIEVSLSNVAFEFNNLPADAQYIQHYIRSGIGSSFGPFTVEQTSGTVSYGGSLDPFFVSYPLTYENRIDTLVDGVLVYQSSVFVTCTGDATGPVTIVNNVPPPPGDDQYRRWLDDGKTITCTDIGSEIEVRLSNQDVEFSTLPADAQFTSTTLYNGVGGSAGPFTVEQTSGTRYYGPLLDSFASYPLTYEIRIDTLIDDEVVYQSSIGVTCTGDATIPVTPVNNVPGEPTETPETPTPDPGSDQYRRWLDNGKTFTCTDTGNEIEVVLSNQDIQFNLLPPDAQYTEYIIRNGFSRTLGTFTVEQTSGTIAYGPLLTTFNSYPLTYQLRIDTLVDGVVVYQSKVSVTCTGDATIPVTPVNIIGSEPPTETPTAAPPGDDQYRRWLDNGKIFTCIEFQGGLEVRLNNQDVQFNNLPADAQYTVITTRNGVATSFGILPVEQTSGTIAYGEFLDPNFVSYPLTYEMRIDTLIDGVVVYQSSIGVTCTDDAAVPVTPVNTVGSEPPTATPTFPPPGEEPFRRWIDNKTYTCVTTDTGVEVHISNGDVQFNNLPADARFNITYVRNGNTTILGPYPSEQTSGTLTYPPSVDSTTFTSYPVSFEERIDTLINGFTLAYQSSLYVYCNEDGSGAVQIFNLALPTSPITTPIATPKRCLTPLPTDAVQGRVLTTVKAAFEPRIDTMTDVVLNAGTAWWVIGAQDGFYKLWIACDALPVWIQADALGPNYDPPWNGAALPSGMLSGSTVSATPEPPPGRCVTVLPANAVQGRMLTTANGTFEPRLDTMTDVVLPAGSAWWVSGAQDGFYRLWISCEATAIWVPADAMGPNYDPPWNGAPLPAAG